MIRILCCLLTAALLAAAQPPAQPGLRTWPPGSDWQSSRGDVPDAPGGALKYCLRLPKQIAPGKKLALLVTMHGLGADEFGCYFMVWTGIHLNKLDDDYAVLGLKSRGKGWNEADFPAIRHAIEWAMKTQPIDPRRVYGWGESNGAMNLARFAPRNADLMAAAVLVSGNARNLPKPGADVTEQDLTCFVYHGSADKTVPTKEGRAAAQALADNKYFRCYREVTDEDHFWGKASVDVIAPQAFQFLDAQRLRRVDAAAADACAKLVAQLAAGGPPPAGPALLSALNEGGNAADALAAAAAASTSTPARLAVAHWGLTRLPGIAGRSAVASLCTDADAQVRDRAIAAAARYAGWQDSATRQRLLTLLADAQQPAPLRALIAGHLGAALTPQRICVNRDAEMVAALTEAAKQPAPVGSAAQTALENRMTAKGHELVVAPVKP